MTPPRSSALSEARRAQLEALAKETKERVIDVVVAQLMVPDDDEPALSIRRQANHEQIEALLLDALLRAEASPPSALPAETPRAETCATCRFYGDVCYHGIGIPLAGPGTWGCTLHEPQASRAVEGDEPEPTR